MLAQAKISAQQFLCDFFQCLEEEEIRYTVLRGYEGLPECVCNDIDIFVHPLDIKKAQGIAKELAGKENICSVTSHFGLTKYILVLSKCEIITIDFFTHISWKGFFFADSIAILQYTKKHNGLTVSKEGTEAAIIVLKELLMCGEIKSRNNARDRIVHCLQKDELSFVATIKLYLGTETEWLSEQINNQNWRAIEVCTNKIRRKIIIENLKTKRFQCIGNVLSWAFLRIKDKFLSKRGCFAVIIGPDGSGKTTLVIETNAELEGTLFTKTNHFASNFEILPLLSTIVQFSKGKGIKKQERGADHYQGYHSGMKQKANSPLRSCIYIIWYSLDLIFGHFILWRRKSNGELVFFARYFYDYYYQRSNRNAPLWLINFIVQVVPKPDLVFYIDREAQNIFDLKPELSIEEIQKQQSIIGGLAEKYEQFTRIDCNGDVEFSKNQIIAAIANYLTNRTQG